MAQKGPLGDQRRSRRTSSGRTPATTCRPSIGDRGERDRALVRADPRRPRRPRQRVRQQPDGAAAGRRARSASRPQIGDVFFGAGPDPDALRRRHPVGQPRARQRLPFPPLDGGRMLMIVLKALFGTRISLRAERLTYLVGFVFLFAFLIWVTGFDIVRILRRRDLTSREPRPDALTAPPPADGQRRRRRRAGRLAPIPIVVQSMTNTDTADAGRDRDPGRPARPRRLAARPDHGQHRGGRGGRARDRAQARGPRRRRADHRRLPLQRPPAAGRVPGDGRGARQVPDQPGQRRRQAPRRALRDDRPGRDRQRQAGPDRRQLGLARPGAADRADGRERRAPPSRATPAT